MGGTIPPSSTLWVIRHSQSVAHASSSASHSTGPRTFGAHALSDSSNPTRATTSCLSSSSFAQPELVQVLIPSNDHHFINPRLSALSSASHSTCPHTLRVLRPHRPLRGQPERQQVVTPSPRCPRANPIGANPTPIRPIRVHDSVFIRFHPLQGGRDEMMLWINHKR